MENYTSMMSSLQNLDLGYGVCGNQEGSSRNNGHGVFDASHYSCFSPKPQCVGQGHAVQGPHLVDHTTWTRQGNGGSFMDPNAFSDQGQLGTNFGPGYSWMYNEANQVPGISMPSNPAPAHDPSYMGGSILNHNGYSGQGFTQPRSHGQNGKHNQAFTETRSNGQNGYGDQQFTGRSNGVPVQSQASMTNLQDIVSMAMRNEGLIFLQNAIVVELVLCMRVMNEILCRAVPQVEAKEAVPRDDQQTPNRTSSIVQDSPVPTHSKRIFVGGLASTVTESDFKTYFDQFGTITNVELMYDHTTRRTRGFGFITFDSEKAVDKVLLRTSFHELNGKMAEVKRAIPKDIYRKSIRGQLGGLNSGLSRVSNLLSAYTQGYNPSQVGGSGLKVDGRFSPAAVSGSGHPSFSLC